MIFKEELFTIVNEGNYFKINGRLNINDYTDAVLFFYKSCENLGNKMLIFDFADVAYINSKGIRNIAKLLYQLPNHIKIIVDKSKEWQIVGIVPLSKIRPEGEIITELKENKE